jgi:hypothetical protein
MTDIIIEDWETMSWDFSNDDVEDNEYDEDNFQDEDEQEYFKEPINLTLSLKKLKFAQNIAEIKNINEKKDTPVKEEVNDDTNEYMNIVKPHLNWVKKQKIYDEDSDDSDSDSEVVKVKQQPIDNNFPELSIKTLSMKKIVNDNSWLQQRHQKSDKKEVEIPIEPKFVKYDKVSMVKTRMCNSGNKCSLGNRCKFAHNMEELNILKCTYNNCNLRCNFLHKNETKEQYFERQKQLKLPQEISYALSKISIDKKIVVNGTIYNGKVKENKIKKDVKFIEEDPNTVYIRNRNKKTEDIRIMKSYISKNEESIKRLKYNNSTSSSSIIKKLQEDTIGYKNKLIVLEDEFSKIKLEKKKKVEEIKIDVVVEKPVIIVKEIIKEKPQVTVELITNKVKEEIEVIEDKNKNAWVEIKKQVKHVPSPVVAPVAPVVAPVVQKSQMCRSYTMKTKCPHGVKCRYAHNPNELNVNNCGYGSNCKLVKIISNEYINNGTKCCIYKHPNETKANFFKRNKF